MASAKIVGTSRRSVRDSKTEFARLNVGATGRRAVLLPFKHEDVRLSSAYSVDGHRQGFAIGRKLDFLGVRDLAVELAG